LKSGELGPIECGEKILNSKDCATAAIYPRVTAMAVPAMALTTLLVE